MAHPFASSNRSSRLKAVLVLLALGLGIYIVGPSLYWELTDSVAAAKHSKSCSPCHCDCAAAKAANPISDCEKLDSMPQDADHNTLQNLREELNHQETVDEERQLRADNAYLEIKKLTSQYQKEAEKCNVGMETSEEAREKAEALLALEMQETKIWEYRARQLGWQDANDKPRNEFESVKLSNVKLVELGGQGESSVKLESSISNKSEETKQDNF